MTRTQHLSPFAALLAVLAVLPMPAAASGDERSPVDEPSSVDGFGPWHFGMTREQVSAVEAHGPYHPVRVTGGLETPTGEFAGLETNTSFVFNAKGLHRIQIWAYEGKSFEEAAAAWHRVYRHVFDRFGGVLTDDGMLAPDLTVEDIREQLRRQLGDSDGSVPLEIRRRRGRSSGGLRMAEKLYLYPIEIVPDAIVVADFVRSPGVYLVLVHYIDAR